jgi:hypothetical protein
MRLRQLRRAAGIGQANHLAARPLLHATSAIEDMAPIAVSLKVLVT